VTRQGIFFSGMQSRIGRNVQFLCEHYEVCRQDLLNSSLSGIDEIVDRHVGRDTDPLSLIHAQLVYELSWLETVYFLCLIRTLLMLTYWLQLSHYALTNAIICVCLFYLIFIIFHFFFFIF